MGLIRKALFLTTPGLVSPNSKKQRTANKTNRLLAKQNKLLTQRRGVVAPQAPRAVAITPRYRVTCPSCKGEMLAPASASIPCPHCQFNMSVTPKTP